MKANNLLLILNNIETVCGSLLKKGKKRKAYFLIFNFLKVVKNSEINFLYFFKKLKISLSLKIDFKSQNKSGVQQKVPKKISSKRRFSLPMRWLIENSKKRKELSSFQKLFFESLDSFEKKSVTYKKRSEWHKTAINNKHLLK